MYGEGIKKAVYPEMVNYLKIFFKEFLVKNLIMDFLLVYREHFQGIC